MVQLVAEIAGYFLLPKAGRFLFATITGWWVMFIALTALTAYFAVSGSFVGMAVSAFFNFVALVLVAIPLIRPESAPPLW